jgi:TRAP-type uncharacterized transport system fused permease subunit
MQNKFEEKGLGLLIVVLFTIFSPYILTMYTSYLSKHDMLTWDTFMNFHWIGIASVIGTVLLISSVTRYIYIQENQKKLLCD